MNTRLKVICILFAVAYILTMAYYVIQQMAFDSSQFEFHLESSQVIDNMKQFPRWNMILFLVISIIVMGISFLGIFIFVFYIPFQIYKIIKSVVNDKLFDLQNVKRIRYIGYSILLYSALIILIVYPYMRYTFNLFEIESKWLGMNILSINQEFYLLLIGLLTLLFAEIMKISHTIKEENDLMI